MGMMSENGNLSSCFSERKMEGEDSVRRVDCLRGRLLAERAASRNAKEEAEQLQNKLIELEKLLKQESKSRKRAEKKLKFLMKKLESINITPHDASDGSQLSESIDKTDVSSISSTPSSITKQQQQQSNQNQEFKILDSFEIQESEGKDLGYLEQIDSQNSSFSLSGYTSTAECTSVSSAFESLLPEYERRRDKDVVIFKILEQRNATFEDSLSEKSSSNMDQQSDVCSLSIRSSADEEGHDCNTQIDNSMALVLVNKSQKIHHRIDPAALDDTVRGVLDTLQRAKEELRSSMERRRMNMMRVGGKINTSSTVFI